MSRLTLTPRDARVAIDVLTRGTGQDRALGLTLKRLSGNGTRAVTTPHLKHAHRRLLRDLGGKEAQR